MSNYLNAKARYTRYRTITRELLEEDALHVFKKRVHVVAIDDDIIRRVRQDWASHPKRLVHWDWEQGILVPMRNKNCRGLDLAILVQGQLCALAVARVSDKKRWISLTHIEGAPGEHPLKGMVLPLIVNGLFVYRAVISDQESVKTIGIRILNPLDEALQCYEDHGYTLSSNTKRLRSIDVSPIAM